MWTFRKYKQIPLLIFLAKIKCRFSLKAEKLLYQSEEQDHHGSFPETSPCVCLLLQFHLHNGCYFSDITTVDVFGKEFLKTDGIIVLKMCLNWMNKWKKSIFFLFHPKLQMKTNDYPINCCKSWLLCFKVPFSNLMGYKGDKLFHLHCFCIILQPPTCTTSWKEDVEHWSTLQSWNFPAAFPS